MKFTKKELKNLRKLSDSVKAVAFCHSQKQIKDSAASDILREIKKAYPQVQIKHVSRSGVSVFKFSNYPGENGNANDYSRWRKFLIYLYRKYTKQTRVSFDIGKDNIIIYDSVCKDNKAKMQKW